MPRCGRRGAGCARWIRRHGGSTNYINLRHLTLPFLQLAAPARVAFSVAGMAAAATVVVAAEGWQRGTAATVTRNTSCEAYINIGTLSISVTTDASMFSKSKRVNVSNDFRSSDSNLKDTQSQR